MFEQKDVVRSEKPDNKPHMNGTKLKRENTTYGRQAARKKKQK